MEQQKQIKITLTKSLIGRSEKQRRIAKSLGLTKTHDVAIHQSSTTILGMVKRIPHLVNVESFEVA